MTRLIPATWPLFPETDRTKPFPQSEPMQIGDGACGPPVAQPQVVFAEPRSSQWPSTVISVPGKSRRIVCSNVASRRERRHAVRREIELVVREVGILQLAAFTLSIASATPGCQNGAGGAGSSAGGRSRRETAGGRWIVRRWWRRLHPVEIGGTGSTSAIGVRSIRWPHPQRTATPTSRQTMPVEPQAPAKKYRYRTSSDAVPLMLKNMGSNMRRILIASLGGLLLPRLLVFHGWSGEAAQRARLLQHSTRCAGAERHVSIRDLARDYLADPASPEAPALLAELRAEDGSSRRLPRAAVPKSACKAKFRRRLARGINGGRITGATEPHANVSHGKIRVARCEQRLVTPNWMSPLQRKMRRSL